MNISSYLPTSPGGDFLLSSHSPWRHLGLVPDDRLGLVPVGLQGLVLEWPQGLVCREATCCKAMTKHRNNMILYIFLQCIKLIINYNYYLLFIIIAEKH